MADHTNRFMVIVSRDIDHTPVSRLTQQFTLLLAFRKLPQVFDNKRDSRIVPLAMSLSTSCRSAGDARCPLHHLIDDETLSLIVLFDLDVPTVMIVGSNPSCSSFIQRNPRTADTNYSPS